MAPSNISYFVYLSYIALALILCMNSDVSNGSNGKCSLVHAFTGIDLSLAMTESEWNSYTAKVYKKPIDFAIMRIYQDNATTYGPTPQNIIHAWKSGIHNISLYMFPCIAGSRWTKEKGSKCPPAEQQLDEIVHFLGINGIVFKEYSQYTLPYTFPTRRPTESPTASPTEYPTTSTNAPTEIPTASPTTANPSLSPTMSPTATPSALPTLLGITFEPTANPTSFQPTFYPTSTPTFNFSNTEGIYVESLYIDVEDDNPTRYYDSIAENNIKFIADFVNYAWSQYKIRIGIYTTRREWGQIMGPIVGRTNANPFRELPLWTPRYDSRYSMDFYTEFAGWSHPYIKQLKGGASNLRRFGSGRINMNYIEEDSLKHFYNSYKIPGPMNIPSGNLN